MKEVFDKHYKEKFAAKGLLKKTGGRPSSAPTRRAAAECAGVCCVCDAAVTRH